MSFLNGFFGSKPVVPKLPPISMAQGGADAMAANEANLGAEQKLASEVNLFNEDQINQMYSGAGFDLKGITKLASSGISKELNGELPLSDLAQRELGSVAASFGGGYGGSPMQGNRVARDVGLTETNLFGTGLSQAEQWMSSIDKIYAPGMMNIAAMQFTPQQGLAFDVEERNMQWQRKYLQNQVSAMPDPVMSGLLNTTLDLISSVRGGGATLPTSQTSPSGMGVGGSPYAGTMGGMDSSPGGAGFGGDSGAPAIDIGGQ